MVLISGASGLVGEELTAKLLAQGHRVHALTRRKPDEMKATAGLTWFQWDVSKGEFDPASLAGVTDIVHLAGTSIGGGPWTASRREAIRHSRVESIRMIFDYLDKKPCPDLRTVVSASATGIYEPHQENLLDEQAPVSQEFLGRTCVGWESVVSQGATRHRLRAVCLRSGVVLSRQGGMYAQLRPLVRMGLGVIPGTGKQWLPWVHVQDAVQAYMYALHASDMRGAYNLVAPEGSSMGHLMRSMARALGRKIWLPPVPSFLIRLGMGRMSALLLDSMLVSSAHLQEAGFVFEYPQLEQALDSLEENA